jgi:hypothetical protein
MIKGLPMTGISGFGIRYVSGLSRVPKPPTSSTAFTALGMLFECIKASWDANRRPARDLECSIPESE